MKDAQQDRRVVQCNYAESTGVASKGARAYVVALNRGNGNDRIPVLVLSRGKHWVEKWEDRRRLTNFGRRPFRLDTPCSRPS